MTDLRTAPRRLQGISHAVESPTGAYTIEHVGSWQADEEVPGGFVSEQGSIKESIALARPGIFRFGATLRSVLDDGSTVFSSRLLDPGFSAGRANLVGKGWKAAADRTADVLLYQATGAKDWAAADNQDYLWESTLVSGITNTATSLTVAANGIDGLSDSSEFRIKVDNEIMVIDSITSGDGVNTNYVLHVAERGADGGSAKVAHLAGATVKRLLRSPDILGDVQGNRLAFHVNANRKFKGNASETGVVFWAAQNDITRVACRVSVMRDDSDYTLVLRGGVGPTGKLLELQTWSLGSVGDHFDIDYSLGGDTHYDIIYFGLRRVSGGKKSRAFRCELESLRVNGAADGDTFTTSDLARDLAARMGVRDALVDDTTTNVLPLYVKAGSGNYADLLTAAAAIEGFRWVIIDTGYGPTLDFGPWTRRVWRVADENATYDPVSVDRYNVVRVPFAYPSGATSYVEWVASPDPLSPEVNIKDVSLSNTREAVDQYPSEEYATRLAEALGDHLMQPRMAGSGSAVWVLDAGENVVDANLVHAGDTVMYGDMAHRIKSLNRKDGAPQWTFDDEDVMVDRLIERASWLLSLSGGQAKHSLHGHTPNQPAAPNGYSVTFDQNETSRTHRGQAVAKADKVSVDIDGSDKIAIRSYRGQFRECDASGNDLTGGHYHNFSFPHLEADGAATVQHALHHTIQPGHYYQSRWMALSTDHGESDWTVWSTPALFSETPPAVSSASVGVSIKRLTVGFSLPADPDGSGTIDKRINHVLVEESTDPLFATVEAQRTVPIAGQPLSTKHFEEHFVVNDTLFRYARVTPYSADNVSGGALSAGSASVPQSGPVIGTSIDIPGLPPTSGLHVDAAGNLAIAGTSATDAAALLLATPTSLQLRTAHSGRRIEIDSTPSDRIDFYTGSASEVASGYFNVWSIGTSPTEGWVGVVPPRMDPVADTRPELALKNDTAGASLIQTFSKNLILGGPSSTSADLMQLVATDTRIGPAPSYVLRVTTGVVEVAGETLIGGYGGLHADAFGLGVAGVSEFQSDLLVGGALLAADGSLGAPGIAFTSDANTGVRRVAADTMALTAGGVDAVTMSPSGISFGVPINDNDPAFVNPTTPVPILYVDPLYGSDSFSGRWDYPFATIQAAVDSLGSTAALHGGVIQLSRGDHLLPTSLVLNHKAVYLQGVGIDTRLVWTGSAGGDMIQWKNNSWMGGLSRMHVVGDPTGLAVPATGLHVIRNASTDAGPNAHNRWQDCWFGRLPGQDTAPFGTQFMQVGILSDGDNSNNDMNIVDNCYFAHCDYAIRLMKSQNEGWDIRSPKFFYSKIAAVETHAAVVGSDWQLLENKCDVYLADGAIVMVVDYHSELAGRMVKMIAGDDTSGGFLEVFGGQFQLYKWQPLDGSGNWVKGLIDDTNGDGTGTCYIIDGANGNHNGVGLWGEFAFTSAGGWTSSAQIPHVAVRLQGNGPKYVRGRVKGLDPTWVVFDSPVGATRDVDLVCDAGQGWPGPATAVRNHLDGSGSLSYDPTRYDVPGIPASVYRGGFAFQQDLLPYLKGLTATILTDTFTRANSATSLGTADSGQAWTGRQGTWGISSNKGYVATPNGASIINIATIDPGVADGTWAVPVVLSATRAAAGVVLRWVDNANFAAVVLQVTPDGTNKVHLDTRLANTQSTRRSYFFAAGAGLVLGNTYTLKVIATGVNIQVLLSGTLADSTVLTDQVLFSYNLTAGTEATTLTTPTPIGLYEDYSATAGSNHDDNASRWVGTATFVGPALYTDAGGFLHADVITRYKAGTAIVDGDFPSVPPDGTRAVTYG